MTTRAANDSIKTLTKLNHRMDSLLDLTRNFRESFFIDVLMDSITVSATQILNAEASSILLYDEEEVLRFAYVNGKSSSLKGKAVDIGGGITGWVAKEGKSVIINDVKKDPRFSDVYDRESGFATRSIVCVPLLIDGRNIGILEVLNKKEGEFFTEQDQKILYSLADHAAISIQRSKSYESSHSDFIQITEILMTAMDYHVPEKKGHARRVSRYSVKLAKAMGLNEEEQKKIYFGALLHDIGLLKYNQDEYWGLKKFELHPSLGFEMIKAVSILQPVANYVLSHHERYDGGGYPKGLSGQDIPLGARIISVAEVFDILVSGRSYKPAMGFIEAAEEIKNNSGIQFDPHVVDIFLANFSKEDIVE
jgi:putative nucleotidyltransferase with HDIG domain